MKPFKKLPLFIVTGASGVGKSTTCNLLFQDETDYIVMESDLLWNDIYNTPEDDYHAYRELWLRVCANISQIGKPVVLCGCATPKQFESCKARSLFSEIFYLAVVCSEEQLENRMRIGRGITDENWLKSSKDFNHWLIENANKTTPNITLLDNSTLTPKEAAQLADMWIHKNLGNRQSGLTNNDESECIK